jgi:hypothetical protein
MNTSARRWLLLLGAILVVQASEEEKREKGNKQWRENIHSRALFGMNFFLETCGQN